MPVSSFFSPPEKKLAERRMACPPKVRKTQGHQHRLEDIPQAEIDEKIAVVQRPQTDEQSARVSFRGASWPAKSDRRKSGSLLCKKGTLVRVICQQGNTLIVEALEN